MVHAKMWEDVFPYMMMGLIDRTDCVSLVMLDFLHTLHHFFTEQSYEMLLASSPFYK